MGTPPEDESGAGEGAPVPATDPRSNERHGSLASRIDKYMEDDGPEDAPGGSPEPSIQVDMDELKPRTSAGSIESRPTREPEHRSSEGSIEVNLDSGPVPKVEPDFDPLESPALKSRLQSEPGVEVSFEDTPVPTPVPTPPAPRATGTTAGPNDPLESPALKSRLQTNPVPKVDLEEDVDDEAIEEISQVTILPTSSAPSIPPPKQTQIGITAVKPPSIPPPRPPGGAPPPLPPKIPTPKIPPIKPPSIPVPRQTQPGVGLPNVAVPPIAPRTTTGERGAPPPVPRTPTGERPPLPKPPTTGEHAPLARGTVPTGTRTAPMTSPQPAESHSKMSVEDVLAGAPDLSQMEGGIEAATATPNVVVDQPLETRLDSPTVVETAIAALSDLGGTARAQAMTDEVDARELSEPAAAAIVAYELGELCDRRLNDEARAVKAYNRALSLDPSLRPNLWAIRRVFYKRQLWPNLQKLVDAEVEYARDDYERADLLLEKARISHHRLDQPDDARHALDEAAQIAPTHQGVLLELERVIARSGDVTALLDVWDRLADAVEQPARKVSYLLEVGRAAGAGGNVPRAQDAFDKAASIAQAAADLAAAERIARERLRVAEEHGTSSEASAAIDALATVLMQSFGPAGPGSEPGTTPAGERPTKAAALRLELVALRRRQAQLARKDAPDRSWEYLQQALALSPGEPIVLADLTELAEELGRYEELAELVQNWQSVEGDPARAMSLSLRRVDALLRGGNAEQARGLLASLEATAPGFIVLTSAAERDALARGDMAALANTYLTAGNAAFLGTWVGPGVQPRPDMQAAATLYVQGAELLAYEVGTAEALDEARAALGKALEAVPAHPAALEALTELDDITGRVVDAVARLRSALASTTDSDAKRAIIERAIRLTRSHGDLESMLDFQRELAALLPGDMSARWRLESSLAQLARDDERAELLVKIAADETDATGRGTALLAAARLRERAGAVEAATELYRQVLALWPDDTFSRESLLDLLRAQERWQELVVERRTEAKSLPDGPSARRALREAAWILEIRLDDAAQAAQVYDDWLARMPDDRAALEGIARCRAKFGDRNGEVSARAAIAESDRTADAAWLHGRALERAGQFDEAADVYRSLIASEDPTVAATAAALGLSDIAAARGDTVTRVEATAALAGRAAEPRLAAALAEDSGWMYALVLEDPERAAQSFEAAIALDPTRRGSHLGAALVAARRKDATALAQAYEGLAGAVEMPEAAAALLLRGAAMAAASGDLALANQRVELARRAAPDDTSALLVSAEAAMTANVEAGNASIDPLLARAEVLEMRSTLADDAAASASWDLDRAEALELAGRLREAVAVVSSVLKTRPDDLRALTALRRMAQRVGDRAAAASAAYSLARQLGDRDARLELLREAVAVFDGPGMPHNTEYAVAAYRRILSNDPSAREFDRFLELLRERADARALISALSDRISFLESEPRPAADGSLVMPDTTVPLLLERATVVHGTGDTEAAMADLDVLLQRAPANVEALRFRADLAFNAGDVDGAVALWRRYLSAESRPNRRGEIELQLAQVLAENTNDIAGAIESLERVVDANPEDAALRERLLGLCLRASDWDRAVRELRALARMRPTPQEKAREELRLGLMLRDRLGDRVGARLALDRARTLDPLNLDVVRELAELLEPASRGQVLAMTADNFRESIMQTPGRGVLYEKLAQVNAWQSDIDARWLALVAVEALSTPSVDQRQVLLAGRQRLVAPTRVTLDDADRRLLRGSLGGTLHELWNVIAPSVQTATGVDPAKLGFVRGDKIALKKLADRYEPLATALACFGIDDVEVYVSAQRAGFARPLAAETPMLCLGADVAGATTSQNRFLLGRAVATLAEGLSTLGDLREGEVAWTIAAALKAADVPIPPPLEELVIGEETGIAERAKVLKKEYSRKAKAAVAQVIHGRGADLGEVDAFKRAAVGVGQRSGLLWGSDLGVALQILDVGKGGRAITDSPAALELAAWSVSNAHLTLRDKLQISLHQGPR